jgi:hypothetical protein
MKVADLKPPCYDAARNRRDFRDAIQTGLPPHCCLVRVCEASLTAPWHISCLASERLTQPNLFGDKFRIAARLRETGRQAYTVLCGSLRLE